MRIAINHIIIAIRINQAVLGTTAVYVFDDQILPHASQSYALQWRDNERDGVLNHQSHDCLLNRLFSRKSKKTSKLRVTGLCEGNSPVTGEFPAHRASNAENVSIWWRHHGEIQSTYSSTKLETIWNRNSCDSFWMLSSMRCGRIYFTDLVIAQEHNTLDWYNTWITRS